LTNGPFIAGFATNGPFIDNRILGTARLTRWCRTTSPEPPPARRVATAVGRLLDGDDADDGRCDQVAVIDQGFELAEHGVGGFPP
jgi:hypothetical protein